MPGDKTIGVPLKEAQIGVYMECVSNPETTRYNVTYLCKLPAGTEIERLEAAVIKAALLHPALFVTIKNVNGLPVMVQGTPEPEVVHSKENNINDAKGRFIRPFDLANGPLSRFEIISTATEDYLLLDIHHLVTDGFSMNLLMNQIADLYEGKDIEGENLSYFEYRDEGEDSTAHTKAAEFFHNKFEGVEYGTCIMMDVDDTLEASSDIVSNYDMVMFESGNEFSGKSVEQFVNKSGVSENTLFTAAFAYTLSIFGGNGESCFTIASNGRHDERLKKTVGMFVKTLPLYFCVNEQDSIREFLLKAQKEIRSTLANDSISVSELIQKYNVNMDISFVYQKNILAGYKLGGESLETELLPTKDCPSELIVMLSKNDGYELRIQYNGAKFSSGLIESLATTYFKVVKGFLENERLSEIELTTRQMLDFQDSVNDTEYEYDRTETVVTAFEKDISKYGSNVALVDEKGAYTYAQVDNLTQRIAAFLNSRGIGRENYVAVAAPKEAMTVIAIWGVIRAGAAFVPLDPAYPRDRLEYMINDCNAELLIGHKDFLKDYSGLCKEVLYIEDITALSETDSHNKCASATKTDSPNNYDVKPGDAITVIYTSGTTGKPKGCVLEHGNLVAFYHNHIRIMEMDTDSRVAAYASFGFDAGIMDMLTTLMCKAALYIIPDSIRLDLKALDEFYCDNGITQGFMTTQVGRMFAMNTKCTTIKVFTVGGEKLVPFKPSERFKFINGYGPSETMAYICCHRVENASLIQPIGRPSGNTKLYVVDKCYRRLPLGAMGQLAIAGYQVGRGYLGLPEKTDEVFVPNPYTTFEGYERMYMTGDMVRMLPDGNLEYITRADGQVKIRGFRVELTEIEEVIRRFDGIEDATVTAFEENNGGKYLAAYIVGNADVDALKAFIGKEKPDYMVPAVINVLESIPYTQNGKVNKRALPVPVRKAEGQEMIPPKNELQKAICEIVETITGLKEIGINNDYFEAGLNSIGILRLIAEIGSETGKSVRIADVKECRNIEKLSALLEQEDSIEAGSEVREKYPLMSNQWGILIESQSDRTSTKYSIPLFFKLSDKIDTNVLRKAICTAIDAHPYLKVSIGFDEKGEGYIKRNDRTPAKVEIITTGKDITAQELIAKELNVCISTDENELYKAVIYITPRDRYLYLNFHHLIADGTSISLLWDDINKAYKGENVPLEKYTAYEVALEEEKAFSSGKSETCEKYYERLLEGSDSESLLAKAPEREGIDGVIRRYEFGNASEAIIKYCKNSSISYNSFFNAAFGYTLSKFRHSSDCTYCTIYNGRNDSRMLGSVGMFVKTLPVRLLTDAKMSTDKVIEAIQNQLMDSMSRDTFSLSKLSKKYGIETDIFFNYQGEGFEFGLIDGQKVDRIEIGIDPKVKLSVEVFLKENGFTAEVTYDPKRFCGDFADSFAGTFVKVAEEFTMHKQLDEVEIMPDSEAALLKKMNATDTEYENVPAHRLFERNAKDNPDRKAVITSKGSITYRELDKKANRLANALLQAGVKGGDTIGLILERSELVQVAEIGIMKAGANFLPMLEDYPDDRIDYCLKDSESRYVVASKAIIASKPGIFGGDKEYRTIDIEKLLECSNEECPETEYDPGRLAYCIYTSGSTGTPKGVMIEQKNITNFVQTSELCKLLDKGNTVLCMAAISFDMSITEQFFSLCRGKTIYIATEEEIHNPDKLLTAFEKAGIDIAMMTPSFAWTLTSFEEFNKALAGLKGIVLGAESFKPALFAKLKSLNRDMIIQNGYGPTECTQVCSVKTLAEGEEITIGSPFANMRFYCMDENSHLLPRYAIGELIISGEGVCEGYVNRPEENEKSFFTMDGHRAYRSKDLIYVNQDNEVCFIGRADNQIKLRGFRIELDEIENVMQEYEGITQCRVIVRKDNNEEFLAGYFTAESRVDIVKLTDYMKSKLAYYMVPSAIMQLDAMPLTQNGKLDKKALPDIRNEKSKKEKKMSKGKIQEEIIKLIRETLGNEECYVDDNFFEIGGTSLTASKVVMSLKSRGYRIEYQDIFDHQTAEELAGYLEQRKSPKQGNTSPEQENEPAKENAFDTYTFETDTFKTDAFVERLLSHNTLEYADRVERNELGDVVLTGPVGFLGCHILKTLIECEKGKVYCIMRRGDYESVKTRLQARLVYYFEEDYEEYFDDRIFVIEGDITDINLGDRFKGIEFETLINCAACVKHYANDNSIEEVNVKGVERMIELCKAQNAKLIQISTTSVPGAHTDKTYKQNLKMTEDRLFVIDDMNNQYCRSKYTAELKVLKAIDEGMRGKIIRVGNLMGRHSDGEFQTNSRTNAFLNGLRGFVTIGKCPLSHSTDPMSFSPVDCTAQAVVLLAGTNDCFTAFNAESRSVFDEMKIIDAINRCGITVTPVQDKEYYDDFYRMMADPEKNEAVSALLTNDRPGIHMVEADSRFTANILYRLGFSWPFVDDSYLEKVITGLDALDFFFRD